MAYRPKWEKVKEPLAGFAGAGIGLAGTDYAAEFTARTLGKTGWIKAGVKALVKGALGLIFYGVGLRAPGAWEGFMKVMAYAGWGGIIPDILAAQFPGGIPGLAERAAVAVRTWSMGAEKVAKELAAPPTSRYDGQTAIEITPKRPAGKLGKY